MTVSQPIENEQAPGALNCPRNDLFKTALDQYGACNWKFHLAKIRLYLATGNRKVGYTGAAYFLSRQQLRCAIFIVFVPEIPVRVNDDQTVAPPPDSPLGSRAHGGNGNASTTQRVFDELRTLIIQGDIAPGERLKVESLKVLLNTGASPIREALSLLTSDQLVERIDQRGFRAAPASETHFREILMLRCQLEDIALRASVENGDNAWEEQVLLVHHRLSRVSRADQPRWEEIHKQFHRTLLQACGSPIMLRFCDQLYDLNIRYRFLAGKSGRYAQRDVASEHEHIVQAVLDRSVDEACRLLHEHYTLTGEFLADNL